MAPKPSLLYQKIKFWVQLNTRCSHRLCCGQQGRVIPPVVRKAKELNTNTSFLYPKSETLNPQLVWLQSLRCCTKKSSFRYRMTRWYHLCSEQQNGGAPEHLVLYTAQDEVVAEPV